MSVATPQEVRAMNSRRGGSKVDGGIACLTPDLPPMAGREMCVMSLGDPACDAPSHRILYEACDGRAQDERGVWRIASAAQVATWKGDADLSALQGQTVRLRFWFRNAKLYLTSVTTSFT